MDHVNPENVDNVMLMDSRNDIEWLHNEQTNLDSKRLHQVYGLSEMRNCL